eukprot:gene15738-biopygen5854
MHNSPDATSGSSPGQDSVGGRSRGSLAASSNPPAQGSPLAQRAGGGAFSEEEQPLRIEVAPAPGAAAVASAEFSVAAVVTEVHHGCQVLWRTELSCGGLWRT